MRRLLLLGLALLLLLSAGAALAAGEGDGAPKPGGEGFEIPHWVIAGGSGRSEGTNYALTGTIGQAVVGTGSGGSFDVCSGFWAGPCGWEATLKVYRVYLPLVVRSYP